MPYNPFLNKKYNAHINVEVCSSISAVKYLYKYVYKGHDRALAELVAKKPDDEIKQFLHVYLVSKCMMNTQRSANYNYIFQRLNKLPLKKQKIQLIF